MLAEGRLNLLERGQQTGRQLLSTMALTQITSLLLSTGREPRGSKGLGTGLRGEAAGGVLQPFDRLLAEHPDWLRGQLQLCAPTTVCQDLAEKLPTPVVRPALGIHCSDRTLLQYAGTVCAAPDRPRLFEPGNCDQLFISLHTVKTHDSHINSKLGVERVRRRLHGRRSWGCWVKGETKVTQGGKLPGADLCEHYSSLLIEPSAMSPPTTLIRETFPVGLGSATVK